jgi:hypothetical protein
MSDETTNVIMNKTMTQAGRFVLRGGYVTNDPVLSPRSLINRRKQKKWLLSQANM